MSYNFRKRFKFGPHVTKPNLFLNGGGSQPPFITSWKTDNVGTSTNVQISLPLEASGSYNFNVDWGDATDDDITTYNQSEVTHTYSTAGTYEVTITGSISGWKFAGGGDGDKLLDIIQWGVLRFGTTGGFFDGCGELTTITATDTVTAIGKMDTAFRNCSKLIDIGIWDMSGATSFDSFLKGCTLYNNTQAASWDINTSTTKLSAMFWDCPAFNQDLSGWDVSNVTGMAQMFRGCTNFNGDISGWITTALTGTLLNCFLNCTSFNIDISGWDLSGVTGLNSMFSGATAFDQDIGSWVVTAITSANAMFSGVTLSKTNYDALLVGWEGQTVLNTVVFDGGNSQYSAATSAAATARANLVADHTWTITDGGPI